MDRSQNFPNEVQRLLEIIRKTGLEETVKWGEKTFTYQGRNVVGCLGFKNHFVLWFYNGVFLSDPYQVLQNAQEGKTKAMRQWRFQLADEIDEVKILEYLHEAIQNEEQGKVWKPEKTLDFEIPALFQEKLDQDPQLKSSFESLSPFKQKEHLEYLVTAKREATQISRMEKIIPMILDGKGLNDKYR
jgi:uncharacterized protein YdeI (YjbR/CyaY-like superfamily)